jgi:hypothetical protein
LKRRPEREREIHLKSQTKTEETQRTRNSVREMCRRANLDTKAQREMDRTRDSETIHTVKRALTG